MKRLKWILCLISILTISLGVVACGGDSTDESKESSKPTTSQSETVESESEKNRVTVIFDTCVSDYEGLKTNTPSAKTVNKG